MAISRHVGPEKRSGKQEGKYSKCAERLFVLFHFIILSRIRGQMDETGGVDNSGFDVLCENMRASLLSFYQTSHFSVYATPRYVSQVNHTPRVQLQLWMFLERLTKSGESLCFHACERNVPPLFLIMGLKVCQKRAMSFQKYTMSQQSLG